MAIAKIKIGGDAELNINTFICICAFCNNHDTENASVEINFRERKFLYLCSKCKKMNELNFGSNTPQPLPRMRLGR